MDFIPGGVNNSAIKHYEKEILSDKINNLFLSVRLSSDRLYL